jgi:hypothetical protein
MAAECSADVLTMRLPTLSLIALLSACAAPRLPACAPGLGAPVTVFTLFFGESIPARADLTPAEWQGFLDDTLTANLPNGYTVIDGRGAWMNPVTHKTIHEPTKIVIAALPDVPASLAAINRVRTTYQIRFHQQLVGMVTRAACGAF